MLVVSAGGDDTPCVLSPAGSMLTILQLQVLATQHFLQLQAFGGLLLVKNLFPLVPDG